MSAEFGYGFLFGFAAGGSLLLSIFVAVVMWPNRGSEPAEPWKAYGPYLRLLWRLRK